jgi:hypothetical protein
MKKYIVLLSSLFLFAAWQPTFGMKKHPDRKKVEAKIKMCASGGLDYSMSLNDMKKNITNKFKEMNTNDRIITKTEFKKIKDNYFLKMKSHATKDMTRIWGIEYVKSIIKNDEELHKIIDVPNYVIVVENPEKPISVTIHLFSQIHGGLLVSPMVSYLTNAKIYFERIDGKDVTKEILNNKQGRNYKLLVERVGFHDFGGNDLTGWGNILKKDNKLYIVDTELKSFAGTLGGAIRCTDYREHIFEMYQKFANDNNHPYNSYAEEPTDKILIKYKPTFDTQNIKKSLPTKNANELESVELKINKLDREIQILKKQLQKKINEKKKLESKKFELENKTNPLYDVNCFLSEYFRGSQV